MVNNPSITFFVSSDCTEPTEASGHTIEEKAETVCWYSAFKESEVNGTKKEHAKPLKVVPERTAENHICESGACESEKKTNKATCKTVPEPVCDGHEATYETKFVDACKHSGMLEHSCDKH